jgi:nitrogen fixation NifU-like protein
VTAGKFSADKSVDSIYKSVLLDHFHNPRNRGGLEAMDSVNRGSNPRCGDEIEVGIRTDNDLLESVRFRGRGCSICLASASIMSECTQGLTIQRARYVVQQMLKWFDGSESETPPDTTLAALGVVRQHPARKKCVLLAWIALAETLAGK